MSLDEAADAIQERLEPQDETTEQDEAESKDDSEETEEQTDQEDQDSEETEGESDDEDSEDAQESEEEDEGDELPADLNELSEALGMKPEEFLDKYKFQPKGIDEPLSLGEMANGYMRQADYTRKTQEISEKNRQFDAEVETAREALTSRVEMLNGILGSVQQSFFEDVNGIDWEKLREEDPAEFSALQSDVKNRAAQFDALAQKLQGEQDALAKEAEEKAEAEWDEYLTKEYQSLLEVFPEYSDDTKLQEGFKGLQTYLGEYGFGEDELQGLVDHRYYQIAHKAKLYDEMQKTAGLKKKQVKKITKSLKPGAKQGKHAQKDEQHQSRMKKLKRSGSIEDAVSVLEKMFS